MEAQNIERHFLVIAEPNGKSSLSVDLMKKTLQAEKCGMMESRFYCVSLEYERLLIRRRKSWLIEIEIFK